MEDKSYVKISKQDYDISESFFQNDKHLDEFISNVSRYYCGKKLTIKTKIVQRYFETYKKTMDFVINARSFGKVGGVQRANNQLVTEQALEGYVEGVSKIPHNQIVNSKVISNNSKLVNNNLEEISKEILPSDFENEKLRLEIEELKKQLLDTEKKERKISVKKKERFEPPTVEEVENYFIENGFRKESGTKAYNYYSVADWQDSKGSKVKNWKQKMQAVWFKDENKQNTSYARNTSTNPTTIVIDENGNTKQSNSEFRPFGLDNNRQEGKPLLRFVNPANVPSFGYVRPTDEVITGE